MMTPKEIRLAKRQRLEHEFKLARLRLQEAQNSVKVSVSSMMDQDELVTLLPEFQQWSAEYIARVQAYADLRDKLAALDKE